MWATFKKLYIYIYIYIERERESNFDESYKYLANNNI